MTAICKQIAASVTRHALTSLQSPLRSPASLIERVGLVSGGGGSGGGSGGGEGGGGEGGGSSGGDEGRLLPSLPEKC